MWACVVGLNLHLDPNKSLLDHGVKSGDLLNIEFQEFPTGSSALVAKSNKKGVA
jgi:hypothetical protein